MVVGEVPGNQGLGRVYERIDFDQILMTNINRACFALAEGKPGELINITDAIETLVASYIDSDYTRATQDIRTEYLKAMRRVNNMKTDNYSRKNLFSNADLAFARAKFRALMKLLGRVGFLPEERTIAEW